MDPPLRKLNAMYENHYVIETLGDMPYVNWQDRTYDLRRRTEPLFIYLKADMPYVNWHYKIRTPFL
jgi:hypothetical protein